ncbi:PH domain-containing protein [Streptomyces sp. NPDC057433]|uniref:PH domain-containing protein n=1 Tax=Streptomyces sp. NPDC057433 TaxID=3346132 RepID=UPI003673E4AE
MTTPEPQPSDREPAEPAPSAEPADGTEDGTASTGSAAASDSAESSAGPESSAASQSAPAAGSPATASAGSESPAGPEAAAGPEPRYADRVYRSTSGFVGGALILGLACWLGVDALLVGEGDAPWLALAALLFVVPLVAAYTLVPAVYANEDRLRVRNPFRTIVLPWGQVSSLRSGYTNEVFSEAGAKYQLWALPVSLRARKRAARRLPQASDRAAPGAGASLGGGGRAGTDGSMDELRELHERNAGEAHAQGEASVRWAYEIIAPSLAGAVLLAVLLTLG